jgi:hypothetical protein
MTAYARDISEGARVRQGQVIGFVGSTGLSTGAHVHYEILVNGRFVDPMRIRLPRGRSLSGPVLASFEQERDRIEAMKSRPAMRSAQVRWGDGNPCDKVEWTSCIRMTTESYVAVTVHLPSACFSTLRLAAPLLIASLATLLASLKERFF